MKVVRILAAALIAFGFFGIFAEVLAHPHPAKDEAEHAPWKAEREARATQAPAEGRGTVSAAEVSFSLADVIVCGDPAFPFLPVPESTVAIAAGAVLVVGSFVAQRYRER